MQCFDSLADAVRQGGTAHSALGTLAPEHPVWVNFARGMGPMMFAPAEALATALPLDATRPVKVLDVSASHGIYGIAFAKRYPLAQLVALDWEPVLEVSTANAHAAGLAERHDAIAGDAFEVDLGTGYDLVLLPNFLHHFDPAKCTDFLQKILGALRVGGKVAIVEFVPNPDRVTPPPVASFSMVMLATTPAGDAYTFAEFEAMLSAAGFSGIEQFPLPPSLATAVVAVK
jgi:SAM-dependent methyltransferase